MERVFFLLVVTYINDMRLIDLWIVAVMTEVNRVSRYVNFDLTTMGIRRSIFMTVLSICYYLIYKWVCENQILECLCENIFYWSYVKI